MIDCWDWHAEVSANIQNYPTEIGEHLERGDIVASQRLRDPGNHVAELCPAEAGRGLIVVDIRERKGPEVISSGSNLNWGRARNFSFRVECELTGMSNLLPA